MLLIVELYVPPLLFKIRNFAVESADTWNPKDLSIFLISKVLNDL